MTGNRELLIVGTKWENTQIYKMPPLLSDFRSFLLGIISELVKYKVASVGLHCVTSALCMDIHTAKFQDNCWMFCSALQQHLGVIARGEYTYGQPQHSNLSRPVRLRVTQRVMSEYSVLFHGLWMQFISLSRLF